MEGWRHLVITGKVRMVVIVQDFCFSSVVTCILIIAMEAKLATKIATLIILLQDIQLVWF